MADSRGKRSRKQVNYALMAGDDSDDDFVVASSTAVKSKADYTNLRIKPKPTEKGNERNTLQTSECIIPELSTLKPQSKLRLSRDEKIFQRDLEQALKLSVVEEQSVLEPDLDLHNPSSQDTILVSSEENTSATSTVLSVTEEPPLIVDAKETIPAVASCLREKVQISHNDLESSTDESSNSSDDEMCKTNSRLFKKQPVQKKRKTDSRPKPQVPNIAAQEKAKTARHVIMPAWNPPSLVRGMTPAKPAGNAVATTGLRIGLSRKARVKPLHPGVQLKT